MSKAYLLRYTESDLGSLECQIEPFLYVSTVYFHTHHHWPTGIDIITGVQYFFLYWGTDDVSVCLEVRICFNSVFTPQASVSVF